MFLPHYYLTFFFFQIIFLLFRIDGIIEDSLKEISGLGEDLGSKLSVTTRGSITFEDDYVDDSASNPESYFFYVPLVKALLEKYHDLFDIGRLAPHLPYQASKFIPEFRNYSLNYPEEWHGSFLKNVSN